MVIAFHDASALVKRYVPEDGADLMPRDSTVLVAAMSEVEVTSAIWNCDRVTKATHRRHQRNLFEGLL